MRIAAALAWYDEPVEFLDRCVRSLEGVVDFVVPLDGRWDLMPGDDFLSPMEQVETINRALRAANLDGIPVRPATEFVSQVEKRAELMRDCAVLGADWILVIDADEYIASADTAVVRRDLEQTEHVCGDVGLKHLSGGRGGLRRRFYRTGTGLRLVHTGYTFAGRDLLPGEPAVDLSPYLTIEHDYRNRGDDRNARDIAYREARQRERVEVWV